MKKYLVYSDGGARGNPGPAGIGVVICNNTNKIIHQISQYLGNDVTNNQAEYQAVIAALEYLKSQIAKEKSDFEIHCFLDSELIVEQLNQRYKIKNENLKPLFWQIRDLVIELGGKVIFGYIPREKNIQADKLVNQAIDKNV